MAILVLLHMKVSAGKKLSMSETLHQSSSVLRKVLMLAYVFPPFYSVGGSIRVVKFVKYLPQLGWLPVVLTIDDQKEYYSMRKVGSETLLSDIPQQVRIYRTAAGEPSLKFFEKERELGRRNWLTAVIVKAMSAARRCAFRNLLPDRYLSWLPFALRQGRQIIKNEAIDAIYATCPPYSVTLIGAFLKLLTGKVLILDFRDDWIGTPEYHSSNQVIRLIQRGLEKWVVKTADKVILVTEWSRNAFVKRYSTMPKDKFVFIPNGCDLDDFTILKQTVNRPRNSEFKIVHAGLLNDSKSWLRSPVTVFQALRHVLQREPDLADKVTLAFTGYLSEENRQLAKEMGLSCVVKELGHLPRDEYIHLMKGADLLLGINYEGLTTLIPGKIYEYWAVGGPPILLLNCQGAAQQLVEKHKLGIVVQPDDVAAIESAVLHVYRQREAGHPMRISTAGIEQYDRKALTKELMQVLSTVVAP